MEILAISFFFVFIMFFTILSLTYRSEVLYFISGSALLLLAWLLLTYGITETTIQGKTSIQSFNYILNATTNVTEVSSVATNESYIHNTVKNDYTNGFGTISIVLGMVFMITPILNRASGGKIRPL